MMKNLLIVDDEERLRRALKKSLSGGGIEVVAVQSAEEALKVMKKNGFDLIITDLVMPEMDGVELLRTIKDNYPVVKLMVITAYASEDTRHELENIGVEEYIEKPFDLAFLKSRVSEILEKE